MTAAPSHSVLAINGGKPVRTAPFAPWPYFAPDDIEAAAAVLRSGRVNYWTGEEGREFEKEFAAAVGTKHAIAVANGTVALELALWALGIGAGDEVIVPSRTFIASASCAVMRGAVPVMADVERESQLLTADSIRAVLSPRTKAVVAVHLAGWPCDMDTIMALARERGLKVVEDCAQAQGAAYKGRSVGCIGDAGAFSFCQDKIMSTGGEGGMLTTNNDGLWERAWGLKDHGKSWDAVYRREHPPGFRWLHESFGTNWRLTDLQSGLGRALLRKVPGWLERRARNAAVLTHELSHCAALCLPQPPAVVRHAWYRYGVFLRPERLRAGWTRDRVCEAIAAEGVPCYAGICSEIYLEKAFPQAWRPRKRLPVARELGETSLTFLVHPTLSETDMRDTAHAVAKVLAVAAE